FSLIFKRIAFTPIPIFLITEAIALWMTLGIIPLGIAWYQKIRWKSSFRLTMGVWTGWEVGMIAIILLAIGGWAIQHELTAISINAGLGFRSQDQVLTMALLNANLVCVTESRI
ncbi:MAG: hypothetical protein MUF59_08085, partial [Candidatus Krumholzibacteria bacterium]|nr:hypothetical protein [Candidatus Krumholzibacteria bacterium]